MAVMENSKKTVYIDLDNTLADYLGMCDQMHISPAEAKYLFRTIPVQHSGDTRSLFCE